MKSVMQTLLDRIKSRPKTFAGAGIALVVLWFLLSAGTSNTRQTAYHTVERGNFLVSIVEGGTLEAVKEEVVRNELEGSSRIISIVPEGTYVKEGDLLVELDPGDAEDRLNQQQITFEKSLAAYIQATNNLIIQESTVESQIRKAKLDLEFAKMDLQKYIEIEAQQEIFDQETAIIQAEEERKLAEDKLQWSEKLATEGFETKNNLDRDRLSVTNWLIKFTQATNQLYMLQEYDQIKARKQYEENVEEAEKELERVETEGVSRIAQYVANARSELNTFLLNSNKLDKMNFQMKATKVYAPQDGLVVYPISQSRFSSESLIEAGAQVRNRQELIKLPDLSQMKVEIKVHESHVNQVNQGQLAYVVLDSMPDDRFAGRVSKVSLMPDSQSRFGNPNLKVYSTEIVITDKLPDVKPGVSARAEIVITNLQDVITVPIQSVTTIKGQQVCFVKEGGDAQPRPVEVGLFNNKFIEIKSGLESGDLVLLAPPYDADSADLAGNILQKDEEVTLPEPSDTPTRQTQSTPRRGEADADSGSQRGLGEGRPEGGASDRRAEMMKRFDKDGNGELDENERQAMMKAFQSQGGGGRGGQGDRPQRQ